MRRAFRSLRAAIVFLTRLPVGGGPYSPAEWIWAPAFFPLVGAGVGATLSLVHRALWPLGPFVDAVFVVGASMMITGALHEDGLADTSDALGGALERARIFQILKDSRIGSFGASALVVSVVGRVALLERLGSEAAWALPVVACAARVAPVWQMALLPYVTPPQGARSAHVARAGALQVAVATLWLGLALGLCVMTHTASLTRVATLGLSLGAVTTFTAFRYHRRAGGLTGDFLGATEQLAELTAYAVLAWHAP